MALEAVFWCRQNQNILKDLTCRDDSITFDSLFDLAICLNNLLLGQTLRTLPPGPHLSQVHRLTPCNWVAPDWSQEYECRCKDTLWFQSASSEHHESLFPSLSPRTVTRSQVLSKTPVVSTKPVISIPPYDIHDQIQYSHIFASSHDRFRFSWTFLRPTTLQLHIPLVELNNPVNINTTDRGPIEEGWLSQHTQHILLQVGCLHQ